MVPQNKVGSTFRNKGFDGTHTFQDTDEFSLEATRGLAHALYLTPVYTNFIKCVLPFSNLVPVVKVIKTGNCVRFPP